MVKLCSSFIILLLGSSWGVVAHADSDYDPCWGVKRYEFLSIVQHNQFVELTWKEFGTLDELFETLTLIQTQKVKPIPVLLFGKQFWERIINFDALIEAGMISARDLELFVYVETAEEAWQKISEGADL